MTSMTMITLAGLAATIGLTIARRWTKPQRVRAQVRRWSRPGERR
jgi:hypothetical protein